MDLEVGYLDWWISNSELKNPLSHSVGEGNRGGIEVENDHPNILFSPTSYGRFFSIDMLRMSSIVVPLLDILPEPLLFFSFSSNILYLQILRTINKNQLKYNVVST